MLSDKNLAPCDYLFRLSCEGPNMKKLIYLLIVFTFIFQPEPAQADISSDRHRPNDDAVKNRLYSKTKKQELTAIFAMSTNDAFYQNYFVGVSYGYHFNEWLSLGVLLNASFQQDTGLTKTLKLEPAQGGFGVTPDVRRPFIFSLAAIEARLAPIYGKINLFSETVIHYDIFLLLSGGLMLTNPPDVTGNGEMGFHPYGAVGVGQRYFLLRWLALRWEFRGLFTYETFENRGNETRFRMDMSFNLGFSFFF
ncbi:MAG TPA: hypothetical protein DCE42_15900 [Myxococcales bacterium]|nr:hypothetical protein [Deltaproteobacteria bacterium]HAA56247.1 hypothetical protein [Myxococcales bacterium]